MTNGIPGKGKVLNQLSVYWFTTLFKDTEKFGPNHLITDDVDQMPDSVKKHADVLRGRCMLVKKLNPVKLEAIVRGFITGSGWKSYQKDGTVCSIKLPDGLQNCSQLAEAIYTPSTKADVGHDENISEEKSAELVGKELNEQIKQRALQFYSTARDFAAKKGIIIADTKFEFGVDENGVLFLADEVLTPDSSRFWSQELYTVGKNQDSYDKQYVRDFLESIKFDKKTPQELPADVVKNTAQKYLKIFKILTGKEPVL